MPTLRSKSGKIKIHYEKGSLPGYTLKLKRSERRNLLDKLVKDFEWGNIVKKLNVLYIYNKVKNPVNAGKFRRDMFYVQKKFSPKKKSTEKSKRKSNTKSKQKSKSKSKQKSKSKSKKSKSKRKSKQKSKKKSKSKRKFKQKSKKKSKQKSKKKSKQKSKQKSKK